MPTRALLAALVLLALAAPAARADGDPASDVLPEQPVFYGSALDLKSKQAAQLDALVKQAKSQGYDINVAVISRLEDMGSATQFWGDMDNYGAFLAGEIGCCVKGRLLIVMPAGYGVTYLGHSSTADRKVIADLPAPGDDVKNLMPGAMDAVVKLAAKSGVTLAIPDVTPAPDGVSQRATHAAAANIGTAGGSGSANGGSGVWLYLLPIAAVVIVALLIIMRRRLRPRVEGA
jgi:hypothetical protein